MIFKSLHGISDAALLFQLQYMLAFDVALSAQPGSVFVLSLGEALHLPFICTNIFMRAVAKITEIEIIEVPADASGVVAQMGTVCKCHETAKLIPRECFMCTLDRFGKDAMELLLSGEASRSQRTSTTS